MEADRKHDEFIGELKKDGPLAFPFVVDGHAMCTGMTLRDYFAAQVAGSIMGDSRVPVFGWAEYIAGGAYRVADAMLHERKSAVATFEPDVAREKMGQVLAAVLDEVGDGTGRTSPDSFLPQALVDRIESVLGWGGAA